MKRGWLVLLLIAALAAFVGPAQAQTTSGFQLGVAVPLVSGKVLSETAIDARVRGELVVSFHGDTAAGCATYGLCAYSGTTVVRPRDVTVYVSTVRRDGRIHHVVTLDLVSDPTGYVTSSHVQRAVPGGPGVTCTDVAQSLLAANTTGVIRGRSVTLGVFDKGGSLLQTRCAGPTDGDLSSVSPAVTIPLARLLRGRVALDLTGSRTFATHGFAGTVNSTLWLKLGKPKSQSGNGSFPSGIKTHRVRIVTEQLRLVRVRGSLEATARGTSDPIVCGLLDSCGLSETLSLTGRMRAVSAQVVATGPARRPYADFLAALGLSRTGRARGIGVFGSIGWQQDVRAEVSQAGNLCIDTAATGGVGVPLGFGGTPGGFTGSWRTRCPGPLLGNTQSLVGGSLDRSALSHRQFTIELGGKRVSSDDGYLIVARGRLSVVLRRGRVTQQVFSEPGG